MKYPLVGCNWLDVIYSNWRNCFDPESVGINGLDVRSMTLGAQMRREFKSVFEESENPIKDFRVKLELKPAAKPIFLKAAVPPYALRSQVAKQLRGMEKKLFGT